MQQGFAHKKLEVENYICSMIKVFHTHTHTRAHTRACTHTPHTHTGSPVALDLTSTVSMLQEGARGGGSQNTHTMTARWDAPGSDVFVCL